MCRADTTSEVVTMPAEAESTKTKSTKPQWTQIKGRVVNGERKKMPKTSSAVPPCSLMSIWQPLTDVLSPDFIICVQSLASATLAAMSSSTFRAWTPQLLSRPSTGTRRRLS